MREGVASSSACGSCVCMTFNHKAAPPPVPQPPGPEHARAADADEPDFSFESVQFWHEALPPHYALPSTVKLEGPYRDDYAVTRARFFANYQLENSDIRRVNLKTDLDKMAVCSRVRRVLQSPARLQRGCLALVGLWPSLTPLCGLAFSRNAVG
jgi:hypothetical protein